MNEKDIVKKLIKKYETRDPYELADAMGIALRREPLGTVMGYYARVCRVKCIILNSDLEWKSPDEKYVLSHELGHSVMHPDVNTPFLRSNTYLSVEKLEIQANKFAMWLLVTDDDLSDFYYERGYSVDMLARLWGYDRKLIELRLNSLKAF